MASRFSLEASIEPTVDRRAADREGERLAGQFEDSLSDIGVDVDGSGIGDLGGSRARGGGSDGGGELGAADAASIKIMHETLKYQKESAEADWERNKILQNMDESMEESFVGGDAGGGGGGGGRGVIGSALNALGLGKLLGMAGGGGSLVAGGAGALAGGAAAFGAGSRIALSRGMGGEEGREAIEGRREFQGFQGLKNLLENPFEGAAAKFLDIVDPTGIGETAGRKLMDQLTIDDTIVAGAKEGIQFWKDFDFTWPGWINDFIDWEFDSPEWVNDFIGWEFTIPEAPGWVSQLLGFFDMGGGGGRSEAARRGGGFQSDQGLFNAADRQNQAANRNRTDVRVEPQINVDPQRLADDVAREAERIFSDLVTDVEDSLRDSANNSNLGSGPRRFG